MSVRHNTISKDDIIIGWTFSMVTWVRIQYLHFQLANLHVVLTTPLCRWIKKQKEVINNKNHVLVQKMIALLLVSNNSGRDMGML